MTKPQHARRTPNKLLALVGLAALAVMALVSPAVLAAPGEDPGSGSEAPVASDRTPVRLDGLTDGTSLANAVNDEGVAVGGSAIEDGRIWPVRWDAEGNVERLAFLARARGAEVQDVNDNGEMVGSSFWNSDDGGEGASHVATYWDADGEARTLWGFDAEAARGIAHAINEDGTIVGEVVDESGNAHAVAWEPNGDLLEFRDLGVGVGSTALDVNDNGDIVGVNQGIGFVIHDGATISLSRTPSEAHTINNNGVPAGIMEWDRPPGPHSFATWWQPNGDGRYFPMDVLASPPGSVTIVEDGTDGPAGTDLPGDMVGSAFKTSDGTPDAHLWAADDGEPVVTLAPLADHDGALAHGINSKRTVVGSSITGDAEHATVWKP